MKINLNPVLLMVCIVLVAVLLSTSAFGQDENAMTLHVIEHATTDAVTDIGDEGDSAGDVLTFANEVYDETNATVVGSSSGFCVRIVAGVSWECLWTTTLEDGQITVEGPFLDAGNSVLAVTGGTGAYANVRGQMALSANNDTATEFNFVYELSTE